MGNGTRTNYTYNGDGDLLSITNLAPDHVTVNSFDNYTYDALGDVRTDTNQDGEWVYTNDVDGQLTGAVFTPNAADPDGLTAQNLQYVYDAAGNRISESINGITTTYLVNNVNEYTSSTTAGATTFYQYDANGNLTAKFDPGGTTNYAFNSLDQLIGVSAQGLSASYTYDAMGNRNSQTINGVTTQFEIDPGGLDNVVATFSGGALAAHYTYGLGLVSQVSPAGTAAYYDFNDIGSTIGITGSSGTYVNRYSYLPYGQTTTITATLFNPFTFVGQSGVMNDGSGLFEMGLRDYDAVTGQFVSNDPLGLLGGDGNIRRYVSNNPVESTDPAGLGHWGMAPLGDNKQVYAWGWGASDYLHLTIGHAQYFFDDDTPTHRHNIGKGQEMAVHQTMDHNGKVTDLGSEDSGKADYICNDNSSKYIMDSVHYDDDIMQQAIDNTPIGVFGDPFFHFYPIARNCQSWRDAVIAEYWRLFKEQSDININVPTEDLNQQTITPSTPPPDSCMGPAGTGPDNCVAPARRPCPCKSTFATTRSPLLTSE